MNDFSCPNCGVALGRQEMPHGFMWVCPSCGGRASGIGFLRRALETDFANALWVSATEAGSSGDRGCPVCGNDMRQTASGATVLDVCKSCRFVWFDPTEFDLAPKQAAASPSVEIPQDQLEAIARLQAETIARRWRNKPDAELGPQMEMIPAVLGWPVEEEAPEMKRIPWVTWSLVSAIAVINGGLQVDLFATATHVYFLAVFGDNVEDFLGRFNYALLWLVAAVAGGGLHWLFVSSEDLSIAIAGAAVSAVVVFYGLRFPQARLRYFRLTRWYSVPASAATSAWFLTQLVGSRDLFFTSNVSLWAFLGGSVVGLWFWLLWRHD